MSASRGSHPCRLSGIFGGSFGEEVAWGAKRRRRRLCQGARSSPRPPLLLARAPLPALPRAALRAQPVMSPGDDFPDIPVIQGNVSNGLAPGQQPPARGGVGSGSMVVASWAPEDEPGAELRQSHARLRMAAHGHGAKYPHHFNNCLNGVPSAGADILRARRGRNSLCLSLGDAVRPLVLLIFALLAWRSRAGGSGVPGGTQLLPGRA